MDIKETLRNYFAKQKKVLVVYLFGSTITGKENKFSDVDIALLFDAKVPQEAYTQNRLSIMDDLSHILDKDVDVIVLNEASSFFKFQIIKNGLRVYEQPGRTEHSFEARAIIEYFDFLPIRRRLETALINNISEA